MRAKPRTPADRTVPWYDNVPIGKNKQSTIVRDTCADAGIAERKTNYSLRASGATALFKVGVPERIIQGTTGHCSLNAPRRYEQVSNEQHQAASHVATHST